MDKKQTVKHFLNYASEEEFKEMLNLIVNELINIGKEEKYKELKNKKEVIK